MIDELGRNSATGPLRIAHPTPRLNLDGQITASAGGRRRAPGPRGRRRLPRTRRIPSDGRIERTGDTPVILLTSRSEETDRILGLELGADDYVTKPFSPRELVARVRSVLRRSGPSPEPASEKIAFDGLSLDHATRDVTVDGEAVDLTAKEFDLLFYLASHPRQVFSRSQLLEHVWDSSPEWQDPATVTVHIRRIRTKIESDPKEPRWLTTVWGVGYRFEP